MRKRCSWAWQECNARPWCCHRPSFHLTCPFLCEPVCRVSPNYTAHFSPSLRFPFHVSPFSSLCVRLCDVRFTSSPLTVPPPNLVLCQVHLLLALWVFNLTKSFHLPRLWGYEDTIGPIKARDSWSTPQIWPLVKKTVQEESQCWKGTTRRLCPKWQNLNFLAYIKSTSTAEKLILHNSLNTQSPMVT